MNAITRRRPGLTPRTGRMRFSGGTGIFGNLANTREDGAWFLQLKWEF